MLQAGDTALMVAGQHSERVEVLKALLEHKDIDVNATNKVGVFEGHHARGMGGP